MAKKKKPLKTVSAVLEFDRLVDYPCGYSVFRNRRNGEVEWLCQEPMDRVFGRVLCPKGKTAVVKVTIEVLKIK